MPITAREMGDGMRQYVLGLYEKSMPNALSLAEKLKAAKRSGYDFLELSIDETDEKLARLGWDRETRMKLTEAMMVTGVPIQSICLSGHRKYPLGHPEPEVRRRSLEIMEGAIGLASDLGVRIIQLAGYDVYYEKGTEQTRKYFEESLRKSVEMASKAGVMLAFETMETEFLNTVKKGMYWVDKINSPYLQMYPDVGNITNAMQKEAGEPAEDLRAGQGHIAAVHLKETRPGVFREIPYGEGHVDFATMCNAAYKLGVRRYLAEFWYDGTERWENILIENCKFLRNFLDQAEKIAAE